MTVSKELNQALTWSSGRALTSLQMVLEAIVVTGVLENYNVHRNTFIYYFCVRCLRLTETFKSLYC